MSTASPWKWLTVVSAVALGTGFIAYRTGFLPISNAQAAAPGTPSDKERVLMYSSKSGTVVPPSSQKAPSTKPTVQRPIMSGSKSMVITPPPAAQQSEK